VTLNTHSRFLIGVRKQFSICVVTMHLITFHCEGTYMFAIGQTERTKITVSMKLI